MKITKLLKITFYILCLSYFQLYTAPQWNLLGLEDKNINCLLFDYLLDGGSNILAGANDGLYFYLHNDNTWINYTGPGDLPVNDIKPACRGRIIAASGRDTRSDAVYQGDQILDGPPFYVFKRIDYFRWPQSLAVKGNDGDTVYFGGLNNIFMTVWVNSSYGPFERIKTPPHCFGGNKTAKCAALQLFLGDALVAGGYDTDTLSPEQGYFLWQRAEDSMHVFRELNVSALSLSDSPLHELYIGTIDEGIYCYSPIMSSPPIKFVSSPNNEPVNDLIVIPGENEAEVSLCVAVNSGVYVIRVTGDDTTWVELGDLPAPPNCVALLNRITADGVLYAGTSRGVYVFDTSNVSINGKPVQKDIMENLKIRNTKSGSLEINFSIHKPDRVTLDVLDLAGRVITEPLDAYFQEGNHMVSLDVRSEYSNGLYVVRLSSDEKHICKKFILLRR